MPLTRRHFLATLCGLPLLSDSIAFSQDRRFALVGTVISGDGTQPRQDHAVVVKSDRIQGVLPASQLPADIPVHGRGTILPGIINAHVHDLHSAEERRDRFLKHGVTSIGNCASPQHALRDLTHNPAGTTATAARTGPMLCPLDGYPLTVHHGGYGLVVTSPAHGCDQVRKLADAGATMIKLAFEPGVNPKPWPTLDAKTATAICNEARRLNLIVRCHIEDFGGLETALNAGVHTIEHVPHRWIVNGKPQPVLNGTRPIQQYRRLLERMARENVILTPTLDVLTRSIWIGPELFEPVRYFHEIGGRIALGNDFPFRRTDAGMPIREMELLTKAGLSPSDVITAGTANSAAACGFSDRGVIAPGNKADIVLMASSPLKNLHLLEHLTSVLKDGMFTA